MLPILLATLISLASAAENPPTPTATLHLGEFVSEALQESPKAQKSDASYREAHWKKMEQLNIFLPTLSVSANHLLDYKYQYIDIQLPGSPVTIIFPEIVPTTVAAGNVILPVFDGFAGVNRFRAALDYEDASEHENNWTKFQLRQDATDLFYKALGAKLLRTVSEQNLKTLEDHLRDIQYSKKAGVSTNYDVLRVEVQVSEAKSALMSSVDDADIARLKLAEVLGKDREDREPEGDLPVLKADLIQNVTDDKMVETITARNDIQAFRSRAEGAARTETASSLFIVPQIYLFGDYDYYNNINNHWIDPNAFRNSYDYGVGVKWTLFDGLASISKARESVEQHIQAEKSAEMAQHKAVQDLQYWKRKYRYFCAVYDARVSDIEKSTESVRLAHEALRVGTNTNTDLLDSETDLYRSNAGAVNAQVGAIDALINLELATGTKIYDFN
jgi:outer membrane protein TolC